MKIKPKKNIDEKNRVNEEHFNKNESGKKDKNSKENEKIKVLAIGDIHGDKGLVKKLAETANRENVDIVIIGGDLTFFGDPPKDIIGPLLRGDRKILLVHGNHEGISTIDFLSNMYPNTKNIHGYSLIHRGVGIFGAGGADFGMDSMSEKDFNKILGKAHSQIKDTRKKIMITHMHPEKSSAELFGVPGSKSIRKAIEKYKPDFALFGHIHETGGIEETLGKTKMINVSRKAKLFEI